MPYTLQEPCDEAVIKGAPDTYSCPQKVGRWVLAATILGSSMAFVDGTVVNVALPVLQSELHATVSEVQWLVEAYALLLAALLLVGGAIGDRLGRRRIFALGVAVFALASVGCGFAVTVNQLIVARGLQGVGGAMLVPGSLSIISASFNKEQRGRAIGTWSGFTATTAAFGPVLGGWIVENVSWRWIFFINVPIAVVVLVILFARVPESRDENATGRLDWAGAAAVTLGLGGFVFGLIESAGRGWDDTLVVSSLVVGAVSLVLFVVIEAKGRNPMMPLTLFRSRAFTAANLLTLFLYSALSSLLFFLPFNLIQVQGYSPTAARLAFLPLIVIISVLSRWAGGLADRHGARLLLVLGPSVAGAGYLLFVLPRIGGSYWTTFFPAIVVLGVGMAISVAPLTTVVMNTVDRSRSGVASGVNNAVSRTAGLVAIALMGIFMLGAFNQSLDDRLDSIEVPAHILSVVDDQRIKLAAIELPTDIDGGMRSELEFVIKESFVAGFRRTAVISFGLALLSAVCGAMLPGGKPRHPA